jgi:hypothetical protein
MLMSSALFTLGTYDDVVDWIWSLGDISSGGIAHAHMDSAGDYLHTEKQMVGLPCWKNLCNSKCPQQLN